MEIENIRAALTRQFYEALEVKLGEAIVLGVDVAVSTDCPNPMTLGEIKLIYPGAELPAGQRWTIYHTSEGLPAAP